MMEILLFTTSQSYTSTRFDIHHHCFTALWRKLITTSITVYVLFEIILKCKCVPYCIGGWYCLLDHFIVSLLHLTTLAFYHLNSNTDWTLFRCFLYSHCTFALSLLASLNFIIIILGRRKTRSPPLLKSSPCVRHTSGVFYISKCKCIIILINSHIL